MQFIYVLMSLFMFEMLSNNSNMCGEDKQFGESYARRECRENSNIRERYRKSDRRVLIVKVKEEKDLDIDPEQESEMEEKQL